MISLWIYVAMTLLLTIGYILLLIYTDGSARHVNSVCFLMTLLMCACVSTMFLIALDGAIDLTYGNRV